MKKSIKTLIILNLLCYFSYLVYTCVQLNMVITSWWVITAFLPYCLVISFVNFTLKVFVKYSLSFNLIILAVVVLFLLNIYLEKRMYKKAVSSKEVKNSVKYYDLSWEDRTNFNDMTSAIKSELFEIPIVIFIFTTITGFKMSSSGSSIIFFSLLDTCLFGYFLNHSYRSLLLFYNDKVIAKNAFVKENAIIVLAIILCVIFAIFRRLGYSSGIDPLLSILGMIPLYPNFVWRNKRALRVNKIRKAKQEKL